MNTILEREVVVPSPGEFSIVWEAFFIVVSAIATYRANEFGPRRFGELSVHAATLLRTAANSREMNLLINAMAHSDKERTTLGILYEEMQYISWKYRGVAEDYLQQRFEVFEAMGEPPQFSGESGYADDADVVGDIETVACSITSILDKLPPWIRKAIEAIMEALKLTRGG